MTQQPYIENPEAIGDPTQTPRLHVPDGPSGDFLRMIVQNNARSLAEAQKACTGAYDCPATDHVEGCYAETPEGAAYAEARYTCPRCAAKPTREDLMHLVEATVTAAGQHRSAAIRTSQARRSQIITDLEAALAAEEAAHTAERDAVRALRDAITRAVAA